MSNFERLEEFKAKYITPQQVTRFEDLIQVDNTFPEAKQKRKTNTKMQSNPKRPRHQDNHGHIDGHEIDHKMNREGLEFLFQKKLTKSDVSFSKRIVIPKKEAESHLPDIPHKVMWMSMVDMDSSQKWTFKYKFWPNSKSTMYVLENTGGFVKSNDLICGDFIMVYKDNESGKYAIKGKKNMSHNEDAFGNSGVTKIFNAMEGGNEQSTQSTHDGDPNDGSSMFFESMFFDIDGASSALSEAIMLLNNGD